MTVSKFSEDKWRAEVWFRGRRVAARADFTRKGEAQAWHDEEKAKHRAGKVAASKTWRVEDLLARYEQYHEPTLSRASRTRYGCEIEKRIKPFFRFRELATIDAVVLEDFKAAIGKDLGPVSANYCLETLRLLLNKAVKWKMLKDSPFDIELFPEPDEPYAWWSDEADIHRFLACAAERSKYRTAWWATLELGLRCGEVIGLWKDSVDFERGRIHVQRQWKHDERDYKLPKHDKVRWVDFNPNGEFAKALWAAKEASRSDRLIFPSSTGRELTYSKFAQKSFKSVIERAAVPRLTHHDMRHTMASWYMRKRGNIWALKEILGHEDIATTQIYAHHSEELRHKPLDMVATHKSRTETETRMETSGKDSGKPWWRIGDSNSKTPTTATHERFVG